MTSLFQQSGSEMEGVGWEEMSQLLRSVVTNADPNGPVSGSSTNARRAGCLTRRSEVVNRSAQSALSAKHGGWGYPSLRQEDSRSNCPRWGIDFGLRTRSAVLKEHEAQTIVPERGNNSMVTSENGSTTKHVSEATPSQWFKTTARLRVRSGVHSSTSRPIYDRLFRQGFWGILASRVPGTWSRSADEPQQAISVRRLLCRT